MKKIIGYLAVAAISLTCVACGNDKEKTSSTAEVTTTVTTEATTAATTVTTTKATTTKATTKTTTTTEKKTEATTKSEAAKTKAATKAEQEKPANTGGSFSASDVCAYYGGYAIAVNQNASSLPPTQNVDVSPSCYYEGDDKIFHYGDVDVYTYPSGGADYVFEITLLSANASTAKGLTVGMTLNDAIAMYGTGTDGGGIYTWYSGASYMYVTTSGGVITSIGLATSI